jgi:hypothetical protein
MEEIYQNLFYKFIVGPYRQNPFHVGYLLYLPHQAHGYV